MNHATNNNLCPVCGYDGLENGAVSGEICSSCGTEFGYSDFERTHGELRQKWIGKNHAQWWSRYTPAPSGWSPVRQLRNIGYECSDADHQKIAARKLLIMAEACLGVYTVIVGAATGSAFVGAFRVSTSQTRSTDFPVAGRSPQNGQNFFQRTSMSGGQ